MKNAYRSLLVKVLNPLASLKIYSNDSVLNYISFVLKVSVKKEKCKKKKKKMRKALETTLSCTNLGDFEFGYL